MTTLLQLADRCQLALNDSGVGTWPQATVEAWVLDAIRDYSQYFPRVRTSTTTITTPGSTPHVFDLPGDFLAVVLVEFPDGEDPPEYLQLRSRTRDGFWDYTGFYDIEPSHDAATAGKLYLSESPTAGEAYTLTWLAPHDTDLDPGDTITVPEDHESLLLLYVLWQATRERMATQEQDPDTTIHILQQMVKAAEQAEADYRRALERAAAHRAPGGWTGPWRADVHDPIY
jgi:hypothetical protein